MPLAVQDEFLKRGLRLANRRLRSCCTPEQDTVASNSMFR